MTAVFRTLLLLILLLAGCTEGETERKEKKSRSHLVQTERVTLSQEGTVRTRAGTLRASREVQIHNQEEGRITSLPFHEGDTVKEGEIVVRLDDRLLEAQLSRARTTRLQAEQDVKRLHSLYQQKLVSDEEMGRAETELESARADETILVTRLGYTRIRAPFAGVVSARLSEPGNVAERFTHLLTLSDPSSLITEVTVSELLLPRLREGDAVQVRIDALGKTGYTGRIKRIHPDLDPLTRRGTVEVELKPVPQGARPGQLCRVRFQSRADTRLTIPFKALRRDAQGEYVFLVDDEQVAHRRSVVSGARLGERMEIKQGLVAGDRIVSRGFLNLKDGLRVRDVSAQKKSSPKQPAREKE